MRNQKKQQTQKSHSVRSVIIFFTVFLLLSVALVYQRNAINELDIQISQLEEDLNTQEMLNNDMEGKLIAQRDLTNVEKIAEKKLGMVKADSQQVTYVNLTDQKTALASDGEQQASAGGGFFKWLGSFLE